MMLTLSVYPHRVSLKNMPALAAEFKGRRFGFPPWPGIFFRLARCGYTLMHAE